MRWPVFGHHSPLECGKDDRNTIFGSHFGKQPLALVSRVVDEDSGRGGKLLGHDL